MHNNNISNTGQGEFQRKSLRWLVGILLIGLAVILAACGNGQAGAAQVVEEYYQALVRGDVNQMRLLSCAAWEESAQLEYEAFGGVDISLQDLACQVGESEGEDTLVNCTGKILAAYGNEVLEIDLAEGVYKTRQEGGEWRMCGY